LLEKSFEVHGIIRRAATFTPSESITSIMILRLREFGFSFISDLTRMIAEEVDFTGVMYGTEQSPTESCAVSRHQSGGGSGALREGRCPHACGVQRAPSKSLNFVNQVDDHVDGFALLLPMFRRHLHHCRSVL
jgi:hypothetical protein